MKRSLLAAALALGISAAQAADAPQPSFNDNATVPAQAQKASTGASAARSDAKPQPTLNDSFHYPY